jgi:hypothetical protein
MLLDVVELDELEEDELDDEELDEDGGDVDDVVLEDDVVLDDEVVVDVDVEVDGGVVVVVVVVVVSGGTQSVTQNTLCLTSAPCDPSAWIVSLTWNPCWGCSSPVNSPVRS